MQRLDRLGLGCVHQLPNSVSQPLSPGVIELQEVRDLSWNVAKQMAVAVVQAGLFIKAMDIQPVRRQ